MNKSLYLLADEMKNTYVMPGLDSYGDPGVFQTYKKGRFFEHMSVVDLKRERDREEAELM
jgi:hypothetical protein